MQPSSTVYGLVEAVKTNGSAAGDTKKATPGGAALSLGRKRPLGKGAEPRRHRGPAPPT